MHHVNFTGYGLHQWNEDLSKLMIGNDIVLCLYLLVGVVGNVLILYIYCVKMKGNKDDRFFIPYLAAMDLGTCIIGASYALALNLLPVRFQGDYLCKTLWFANQTTTLAAGFMLVVIAVQRYLKVCKPFNQHMDLFWKRCALLVVCMVSLFLSAPCWLFYGELEIHNPKLNLTGWRCSVIDKKHELELFFYNLILFAVAMTGLICLIVFYAFIGSTIYRQVKYRKRVSSTSSARPKRQSRDSLDWDGVSDSSGRRNYGRDSLDLDSPLFDPSLTTSSPTKTSDTPFTFPNTLSVPQKEETKVRLSFTQELQKPMEALKLQIPKVRSHFDNHKSSWMFMLITFVFIASFTPRITLMVLESLDLSFWAKLTDQQIVAFLFLYRLYLVNNISNPFFYGLFDKRFRKELKLLCRKNKQRQYVRK